MKSFQIITVIGITSLFIFPFFFSFLPFINTKMILAVLGIVVYIVDRLRGETVEFDNRLWSISLGALAVSFCSFLSMTLNNTPDSSYLGYIVSMLVWLFAAYFCVNLMKRVHGTVSVEIIGYYLMGVALLQCTFALLINYLPILKGLVATYVTGEKFMGVGVTGRLYGVGCALDVGGGRLGAILIIMVYLMSVAIKRESSKKIFIGLLASFFYIVIIGNMMGRTATVGFILAMSYLGYLFFFDENMKKDTRKSFLSTVAIMIIISVIICVILYNTNPEMRKLLRFGFEGFFNYFENGTFETNSTNMLSRGMIFPDNFRTWIIGDGYMASGSNDPYYIGPADYGFYMNTDAGYSRFIFYFGLIGLVTFILFFMNVSRICAQKQNTLRILFGLILILNLAIWVKVSTDLFMIFSPFLCISMEDN